MAEWTVYVSCAARREIAVLAMDRDSGGLRDIAVVAVPGAEGRSTSMPLALRPDRRALYAATRTEPCLLASFAVAGDGALALIGTAPAGHQLAYLATDHAGRHLLGASYGGAKLTSNPIDARGVARAPAREERDTPPCAHSIITDPSDRFVLAASLGGDCILRFGFDGRDGGFTPLGATPARPGAGPRHLRFSPDGRFLYCVNELDASITAYAFDAADGGLAEVQRVVLAAAGRAAADLHITPDGAFLYASERTTRIVAGFAVDAGTGRLSPLGSVAVRSAPRGFALSPDGRFLLCAEQETASLAVFAVEPAGGLRAVGGHAVGEGPNWVTFLG
jgi:6-phosphogluconolactonase